MSRILVVDNYDSFAYNLVQYVGEAADEVIVRRNDAVDVDGVRDLDPDGIVVSPGPGTPRDAGVSMPIFADLDYPTLGVCLGHQALCAVHGATVGHAPEVVHGKRSTIHHDGEGVFAGLDQGFSAGRYHSLVASEVPECFAVSATTDHATEPASGDVAADGGSRELVMGVRHREHPISCVQFHPESVLTGVGHDVVENFLSLVD